jgi:hypothetical protein
MELAEITLADSYDHSLSGWVFSRPAIDLLKLGALRALTPCASDVLGTFVSAAEH